MLEIKDVKNGRIYTIELSKDNTVICINRKLYRVIEDHSYTYTYKIQKTQIKAINGAEGLYDHFAKCVKDNFAIENWVYKPLQNILDNVKALEH